MSSDEQRAWRDLRTDADAIHFIDLFWARRDPTPGTPRNEFLESFNQRVLFADQKFGEPGRRGAITDRGRIPLAGIPTSRGTDQLELTVDNPATGKTETLTKELRIERLGKLRRISGNGGDPTAGGGLRRGRGGASHTVLILSTAHRLIQPKDLFPSLKSKRDITPLFRRSAVIGLQDSPPDRHRL